MMLPALPVANLVRRARRQARRSRPDPLRSWHAGCILRCDARPWPRGRTPLWESPPRRWTSRNRFVDDATCVTFSETDDAQDFFVTFLPLVSVCDSGFSWARPPSRVAACPAAAPSMKRPPRQYYGSCYDKMTLITSMDVIPSNYGTDLSFSDVIPGIGIVSTGGTESIDHTGKHRSR